MRRPVSERTFAAMILGVIGFVIGASILLYDASVEELVFSGTPEFLLWLLLQGVQTALFAIFAVLLGRELRQLRQYFAGNKLEIAFSSLILMILVSVLLLSTVLLPFEPQLVHFVSKMTIYYVIGFLTTVLPAAIGMWLIHIATQSSFTDIEHRQELVPKYLRFREHLQRFISIMGTSVGLAILATGAWRKAEIAAGSMSPEDLPPLYALIYGAYFTLLSALVYFPVYASLLQAGRRIRDAFFPMPLPGSDLWADVYPKREELAELLELRTSAEQSFRTGVAILAPLLSGIIAVLLK